ncbi:MAG: methyltransferase domain-containing protein [Candidatus Gastranaerophilales bacterium]|nr:methyltransferase domain-containing protein [Candidatus Gastranaerophilales bacterium]
MQISNQNIYFKSYFGRTDIVDDSIQKEQLNNRTSLFRDSPTLDFVKDYILENFSTGAHIADFGCSDGEETYSIAAMLAENNKDLRYKITGYDLSSIAIAKAKEGEYKIDLPDLALLEIEKHPEICEYECDDILDKRIIKYRNIFRKTFDIQVQKYNDHIGYDKRCTIKSSIAKDAVNFKVANILDLGTKKLDLPANTNVIIFKNAWHQLAPNATDEIIKKIYRALPPKGILVVGTFGEDHTLDGREPLSKFPLARKIEAAGFKPVFYSTNSYEPGKDHKIGKPYDIRDDIPSVFVKP